MDFDCNVLYLQTTI